MIGLRTGVVLAAAVLTSAASGAEPVRVTRDGSFKQHLQWSPDSKKFLLTRIHQGKMGLWTLNADGSDLKPLLAAQTTPHFDGHWSADSKRIVFVLDVLQGTDGKLQINTVNADGSDMKTLVPHKAFEESPRFAPDGQHVAWVSTRDNNQEIYLVTADGKNVTRVTSEIAFDNNPSWSPDGKRLAFTSSRGGNFEIYVMDRDGAITGLGRPIGTDFAYPNGVLVVSDFQADRFTGSSAITELFGVNAADPEYLPLSPSDIVGHANSGQRVRVLVSSAKGSADPLLPDLATEIAAFEVAVLSSVGAGTTVDITGDLSGLNKDDARAKWGEEQVHIWRRSYDVPPPGGESLRDTGARVWPYYLTDILPQVLSGKNVLVAAHGNSLRSLVMVLDRLTKEQILALNLATGVPMVYKLNADSTVKSKEVLGDMSGAH